jgi:hypothetical protein
MHDQKAINIQPSTRRLRLSPQACTYKGTQHPTKHTQTQPTSNYKNRHSSPKQAHSALACKHA